MWGCCIVFLRAEMRGFECCLVHHEKKRVLVFGSSFCGIGAEPGIYAAIKVGRMHAQKHNR